MNIQLHIERLVLDGMPLTATEGAAVQAALESDLARLLSSGNLRGLTGVALENLSGGEIQIASGSKPARAGNQIAHAVYSSLASITASQHGTQNAGRRQA
jgi:hypothetical protein